MAIAHSLHSNLAPPLRRGLLAVLFVTASALAASAQSVTGFELLGRGVNFGNMLEAPREGEWGVRFDDAYPKLVKAAGFTSVRIPVRWSAHAQTTAPYAIDPEWIARVQHVVRMSLDEGLKVVLNVHHYEEIFSDPDGQRERFLAIWKQIAEAFQEADDQLIFEILNEPHQRLDADAWNRLLLEALAVLRPQHPSRWVMVGPDQWNNVNRLPTLQLPKSDQRLIVTVHYYLPFPFTHQGASWVDPIPPTGVSWTASPSEREAMDRDFETVAAWARNNQRPIYVGEFGSYQAADGASRALWTRSVREACEKHGFSWAYWELASGFGILDPQTKEWRRALLDTLIPPR